MEGEGPGSVVTPGPPGNGITRCVLILIALEALRSHVDVASWWEDWAL